ncbi:signal-regulatory protein delta-like [Erpetoichthys calabaricus]|uniref:signal-regulatory protein delta-like n=1 Tax=Erpetoichthys calabaricus TaxID=27687 RepID=UPI0010A02861|nr:signal-regulatory protein delta-like [Erpetoichthys calabaricus]
MQRLLLIAACVTSVPLNCCQVTQEPNQVEAKEGSSITLGCVLLNETPLGPVRWYKGTGSGRQHFFSGAPKGSEKNDLRVRWAVENPMVNYSISVRDVRVNDTGEYYCEKFRKGWEDKPYASGTGVNLVVRGNQNSSREDAKDKLSFIPHISVAVCICVILAGVLIHYCFLRAQGKNISTRYRRYCLRTQSDINLSNQNEEDASINTPVPQKRNRKFHEGKSDTSIILQPAKDLHPEKLAVEESKRHHLQQQGAHQVSYACLDHLRLEQRRRAQSAEPTSPVSTSTEYAVVNVRKEAPKVQQFELVC